MKRLSPVFILLLVVSCAPKLKLSEFAIHAPTISPHYERIYKPLMVNFEKVSDTLIVTGNGAQKLLVTDYKVSLKRIIRTAFGSTYDTIIFNDQKYKDFRHNVLQEGTTLLLTDVSANWCYSGFVHNYKNRKDQTGCHVSFEGRIYIDGKPRSGFSADSKSMLSTPEEKDMKKIFLDGQKEFAESLYMFIKRED